MYPRVVYFGGDCAEEIGILTKPDIHSIIATGSAILRIQKERGSENQKKVNCRLRHMWCRYSTFTNNTATSKATWQVSSQPQMERAREVRSIRMIKNFTG
jgi:hypothetical protein